MARSRLELQAKLKEMAPKVWYRRPPDNRMTYPCIIYRYSRPEVWRANNQAYQIFDSYNVIYIAQEPDEAIVHRMLTEFRHCSFDREYESDNLYHYSFTLFY